MFISVEKNYFRNASIGMQPRLVPMLHVFVDTVVAGL